LLSKELWFPYGISGVIEEINGGSYTVEETVCVVVKDNGEKANLTLMTKMAC